MLPLTSLLGQPALSAAGEPLGRIRDLTVHLGEPHPRVDRVLVGSRRASRLVPWSALRGGTTDRPAAPRGAGPDAVPAALAEHELLLRRDVLDTQVVDVVGYRISRVADVLLARTDAGGLEVVAVEVGARGVLRRLGLDRLAARAPERALDWASLHLTSSRGHQVQLGSRAAVAQRLDARGLAALVSRLAPADAAAVVGSVDPEVAAGAVGHLHERVGARVLAAMEPEAAARVLPGPGHPTRAAYHRLRAAPHPGRLRRLEGWRLHRPESRRRP